MAIEYDHIDIRELAMEDVAFEDSTGKTRIVKQLNRSKLNKLLRLRAKEGRRIMEPFRLWLITHRSFTSEKAARKGHLVFVSLWETNNNPIEKMAREDIAIPNREELRGALQLFCEWLITCSTKEAEIKWARELMGLLLRLRSLTSQARPRAKTITQPKDGKDPKRKDPFTHAEWVELFEDLEKWHKRFGARWPWARPLFRIALITGTSASASRGLMYIERKALHELTISTKGDYRILKVYGSRSAQEIYTIPFDFIAEEVYDLLRIPAPWGIIADLIAGHAELDQDRVRLGLAQYHLKWQHFAKNSQGAAARKYHESPASWRVRTRNTSINEAWRKTKDLMLMQGMFGINPHQLVNYPYIVQDHFGIDAIVMDHSRFL